MRHVTPLQSTVSGARPKSSKLMLFMLLFVFIPFATVIAEEVKVDVEAGCDADYIKTLAKTISAHRLESPISLDGKLDESVWKNLCAAPLIQNDPDNGCPPRNQTDWWVAYDSEAIYVGARMWDSAPDSVIGRLGRRDTGPDSDWIYLNLDTFNDDRNAYSFSVNPLGVIGDSALYNDGWGDSSWDPIWDVATSIDDHGWCAELRIPFSQLNFPDVDKQVWGVNFSRRTLRYRERDELFHNPRESSGYGSRFPDLIGIEGIKPQRKLEILPFTTAKSEHLNNDPDDPFSSGSGLSGNTGLDLKYGLSSNLNLTATINPDFGQVEVDPAVVNLSDFETFYSEKRPFFVKDANVFRFGREGTNNNWNFNWMDPRMFYSRRVGRFPQLSLNNHDWSSVPENTTILGATKISGKIGNTSVGALSAFTARENAQLELDGVQSSQVVEPLTNYSVIRVKNASSDGRQGLGVMATSTMRDLDDPISQASLDRRAYVAGVDGWTTLDEDGVWAMKGYLTGSYVRGSSEAINDLQLASRRYFQRPNADHLTYDPEATSLSGWTGRAMINKQSGKFRLNSAFGAISPGFEINDLGFQNRADYLNWHFAAGYRTSEPTKWLRTRAIDAATFRCWDFAGNPDNHGFGVFGFFVLKNYWAGGGRVFYNPERYQIRATRGGPTMRVPEHRSWNLWFDTDSRKPLYMEVGGGSWTQGSDSEGANGYMRVVFKPLNNLEFSLGPEYSWSNDGSQYITAQDDVEMLATNGTRYIFSNLEYREFSMSSRINLTLSPKFSLQTFLQPLMATGKYRGIKEFARPYTYAFNDYGSDNGSTVELNDNDEYVIDPDGTGPAEAFTLSNPDFSFRSLKVNMVLRWEYLPGSTFFFVWTQDRLNFDNPGEFDFGRDARSLIEAPGEDIFMAKLSYWFDI